MTDIVFTLPEVFSDEHHGENKASTLQVLSMNYFKCSLPSFDGVLYWTSVETLIHALDFLFVLKEWSIEYSFTKTETL